MGFESFFSEACENDRKMVREDRNRELQRKKREEVLSLPFLRNGEESGAESECVFAAAAECRRNETNNGRKVTRVFLSWTPFSPFPLKAQRPIRQ